MADSHEPKDDPALHEMLRRLPPPSAPPELMASVRSTLRARSAQSVWWHEPLLSWPSSARFAMVALLLILAGAVVYLMGGTSPSLSLDQWAAAGPGSPAPGWQLGVESVHAVKGAAKSVLGILPQSLWWALGMTTLAVYGGCVGAGAWVYRRFVVQE